MNIIDILKNKLGRLGLLIIALALLYQYGNKYITNHWNYEARKENARVAAIEVVKPKEVPRETDGNCFTENIQLIKGVKSKPYYASMPNLKLIGIFPTNARINYWVDGQGPYYEDSTACTYKEYPKGTYVFECDTETVFGFKVCYR